jgi:hypothetical protein
MIGRVIDPTLRCAVQSPNLTFPDTGTVPPMPHLAANGCMNAPGAKFLSAATKVTRGM